MVIKLLKWVLRFIFAFLIWEKSTPLLAIVYFFICIAVDFFALVAVDKLSIRALRKGEGEEARQEALSELRSFQQVRDYPGPPLVWFAQLILGPAFSILLPIIIGGAFLGWFT